MNQIVEHSLEISLLLTEINARIGEWITIIMHFIKESIESTMKDFQD